MVTAGLCVLARMFLSDYWDIWWLPGSLYAVVRSFFFFLCGCGSVYTVAVGF